MFGVLLTNTINQKKKLEEEKKTDQKVEKTYNVVMAGFVVSLAFTVGFFVWLAQSYFMKRGKEMAVLGAIVGSSAVAGVASEGTMTRDSESFTGNGLIESRVSQPVSTETRTVPVETRTVPLETITVKPTVKPVPMPTTVPVETRTVTATPTVTRTAVPMETVTVRPTVTRTSVPMETITVTPTVQRTTVPVELKTVDVRTEGQQGPALKAEDILKDNTQFGKAIIDRRILPLLNNRDVKAKYDNTIMNSPRLSPDSKKMIENYMAGNEAKSAKLYEVLEDILGGISLGDMTFRMKEYAMDVLKESNSLHLQGRLDTNFNRLSEQLLADIYTSEFKPYPIGDKKIPSRKFASVVIAGTTQGRTVIQDMRDIDSRYKMHLASKYSEFKKGYVKRAVEGNEDLDFNQIKNECKAEYGDFCNNVETDIKRDIDKAKALQGR